VAAVLITCVPILVYYCLQGKIWQKLVCILIVAFALNAIILVNSRGAFLGLSVGALYLGYCLFLKGKMPAKLKLQIIGGFITVVALFVYLADWTFWQRMETLLDTRVEQGELTGNSGTGRVQYWVASLEVLKNHPLGVGASGFNYLSPQYLPPDAFGKSGMRAIHSTIFQTLCELGYIGFFLLVGLVISIFRSLGKARAHVQQQGNMKLYFQGSAIAASLVCFLTAAIFIDRLYAEIFYWLIVFAACFVNIYFLKDPTVQGVSTGIKRNTHPSYYSASVKSTPRRL